MKKIESDGDLALKILQAEWEAKLNMPDELPKEKLGRKVRLGNGLGQKTEAEEAIEDDGSGHSTMCPIRLGHAVNGSLDQSNDRPVETVVVRKNK